MDKPAIEVDISGKDIAGSTLSDPTMDDKTNQLGIVGRAKIIQY